jgi:hypothetical protein
MAVATPAGLSNARHLGAGVVTPHNPLTNIGLTRYGHVDIIPNGHGSTPVSCS